MMENEKQEDKNVLKKKSTLIRRVSDIFKNGNSVQSVLFPYTSIQRIRHRCQNLHLFPFTVYTFHKSKLNQTQSNSPQRKAHSYQVYVNSLLQDISTKLLITYRNLRQSVLNWVHVKSINASETTEESDSNSVESIARFSRFEKPKRKPQPIQLILAIYMVFLVLLFQMMILSKLLLIIDYTPGFVFLLASLLFIAVIAYLILLPPHENANKCNNKKTQ